ncbi:MAG: XamI family restriction endonuclease [Coriobacteriia bacterium]|nr:XamI family restriction endonuclease [Coriobacteriia bacterium]
MNADKISKWKLDIVHSITLHNDWFMESAPDAFAEARDRTIVQVEAAFAATDDLTTITASAITRNPTALSVLRKMTAPPITRDKMMSMARVPKSLLVGMEKYGEIPTSLAEDFVSDGLDRLADIIEQMLDYQIFPWVEAGHKATDEQRALAIERIADRMCFTKAESIVGRAQKNSQLTALQEWLEARGYGHVRLASAHDIGSARPGTFSLRTDKSDLQKAGNTHLRKHALHIPVDMIIQSPSRLGAHKQKDAAAAEGRPVLVDVKAASQLPAPATHGTNQRQQRKDETTKFVQLKKIYGDDLLYVLVLRGYYDAGYLNFLAEAGVDWAWEHRLDDLKMLGL